MIFISHSTQDSDHAINMVKVAETQNLNCWVAPRDIGGGLPFSSQLRSAIRQCSVFALLLTENSVKSKFVLQELHAVVSDLQNGFEKLILPVELNPLALPDEFDFLLGPFHRIKITEFPNWVKSYDGNESAVQKTLDEPGLWNDGIEESETLLDIIDEDKSFF